MTTNLQFILSTPSAWLAMATWPKFSITSYRMATELKRRGIEPATVIDVGANVGQFTVACAKFFPEARIHAFEPLPECVEALRRNVRGLSVEVYQCALGASVGQAELHVNADNRASSILPMLTRHLTAFPEARDIGAICVEMSTLDSKLTVEDLKAPVLLKVDVQGYERQVLEGATRTLQRVDYAVLETSMVPLYDGETPLPQLSSAMAAAGFHLVGEVGRLLHPDTGDLLQVDGLFQRSGEPRARAHLIRGL